MRLHAEKCHEDIAHLLGRVKMTEARHMGRQHTARPCAGKNIHDHSHVNVKKFGTLCGLVKNPQTGGRYSILLIEGKQYLPPNFLLSGLHFFAKKKLRQGSTAVYAGDMQMRTRVRGRCRICMTFYDVCWRFVTFAVG